MNTTRLFTLLGKAIGFAASAALAFVNPIAGIAGMATFGGSLAADAMEALDMKRFTVDQRSSPSGATSPAPQPQTSTQQTAPAPRAMNLEYSEDSTEILKKMNKILETQTDMMEMDSQKQEIRESQRSAQDKVWTRR